MNNGEQSEPGAKRSAAPRGSGAPPGGSGRGGRAGGSSKFIEPAPGVRIAYDDRGEGDAVVLVHGLGSSRRRWARLARRLSASGRRVVTFDLRGFGESAPSPGPYDVEALAADLRAVTDACGLESYHLMGHSLGGMVAQLHALAHPRSVRTLTLVSTTSHNGRRASAFGRAMAVVCERGFDDAVSNPEVHGELESLLAQAFKGSAPPLELFRKGLEQPHPAQALAWRATAEFSVKNRLGELRMPVLVVHGTADQVIPVIMGQLIHQAIEGSQLRLMEGAGHHPHRDKPEEFERSLLQMLGRG